jgi:hypothetical protein
MGNITVKKTKYYGPRDIADWVIRKSKEDNSTHVEDEENPAAELTPNVVTSKKKKKKKIKEDEYIEDEESEEAEMTPNLGTARGRRFPTTSTTIEEKKRRKKYLDEIE